MKDLVLPPLLDEPKILEDAHNTWSVENWRNMGKREHGPVFQAGGYPWYVSTPESPSCTCLHARKIKF